jgi:hypothetical protein
VTTQKPKIELKNIQVMESMSEETPCYTASLYHNGALVAKVSNHGHGGPDRIEPVKGITYGMIASIEAAVKDTFPPIDMSEYGMEPLPADLESICHQLVEDNRILKSLKRTLKTKLVFFKVPQLPEKKEDAALYEVPLSPTGRTKEGLAKLVEGTRAKGYYPLNLLSDEQLLEAVRRLS